LYLSIVVLMCVCVCARLVAAEFRDALVSAGMLELVSEFIKHSNADVAGMAARTVSNLADADNKRALAACGIMQNLQQVAATSPDERVRGQCFEALTSIIHGHAENSLKFATEGGIEALLETIRTCAYDSSRDHALELLVALAAGSGMLSS
jgi:hypothetical protein